MFLKPDAAGSVDNKSTCCSPKIRVATSGFIWGEDIEEGICATADFGFHGIEPYRQHILKYLGDPQLLRSQLHRSGIEMVTCSNDATMSCNFIDPSETPQTIEDHVAFARSFVSVLGCSHFKINVGRRPSQGPTSDQLNTLARTLNEIGKRISEVGLRLAVHQHLWGPLEREEELGHVMDSTDPEYVYLLPDTAHLTLGGMDPAKVFEDYWERIAAIHFKDTGTEYRGHKGQTPSREEHRRTNLYKNLGAGGVDFLQIMGIVHRNNYCGWITLDMDPPRVDEGTVAENLEINKQYMTNVLGMKL